jgi:uncharacterized protein (DUF433 family)
VSSPRTSRKKSPTASWSSTQRDERRARSLVRRDPAVMSGDPVFRGTRVPVHMIAGLIAQGSTTSELLHSYPRLTAEMIRLAPICAAAYPLRRPARPSGVAQAAAGSFQPTTARHY